VRHGPIRASRLWASRATRAGRKFRHKRARRGRRLSTTWTSQRQRQWRAKQLEHVLEGIIENEALAVAATQPADPQPSKDAPTDKQKDQKTAESRADRIKSLPVSKQAKAVELLERIVKLAPDSEVGRQAASDLESLRADKDFQDALDRYLVNAQAERIYKGAELFRRAGLHAKALEYYDRVAKEFPDTDSAAKAKEKVIEMRTKTAD